MDVVRGDRTNARGRLPITRPSGTADGRNMLYGFGWRGIGIIKDARRVFGYRGKTNVVTASNP